MRSNITLLVLWFVFIAKAHGDNVITFSPPLPKPWVVVADQTVTATNAISQLPMIAHIKVVLNATNNHSIVISVMPQPRVTTTNNIEDDARNWLSGIVDGISEQHTAQVSKFMVRSERNQKFVETSFNMSLMDSVMSGYSRYWISQTNAIGWVAFGDPGIETNKTVLGITASIHLQK